MKKELTPNEELLNLIDESLKQRRRYSILRFANLFNDEKVNSRIIANILNESFRFPCIERVFRSMLEKKIDLMASVDFGNFKSVKTEEYISSKKWGKCFIDLFLEYENAIIVIENKINAHDGKRQLAKYIEECEKKPQVYKFYFYLSLWGDSPSETSLSADIKTFMQEQKRFGIISYDDIAGWIEDCEKKIHEDDSFFDILKQFLLSVRWLLRQREIYRYINKNYHYIKDNLDNFKNDILLKIVELKKIDAIGSDIASEMLNTIRGIFVATRHRMKILWKLFKKLSENEFLEKNIFFVINQTIIPKSSTSKAESYFIDFCNKAFSNLYPRSTIGIVIQFNMNQLERCYGVGFEFVALSKKNNNKMKYCLGIMRGGCEDDTLPNLFEGSSSSLLIKPDRNPSYWGWSKKDDLSDNEDAITKIKDEMISLFKKGKKRL